MKKIITGLLFWIVCFSAAVAQQATAIITPPVSIFSGYVAGNWYIPFGFYPVSAGSAPGVNTIHLYPAYINQTATLNTLGVRVTTLAASGNVQAAIYANNPVTMRPTGTAIASTASMSTASAASVSSAISQQFQPGLYWFATNADTNGGTAIYMSLGLGTWVSSLIGSTTQNTDLAANANFSGLSVAQTFGTWPDLTSASFTEISGSAVVPAVQMKIGSVP